jgi:hypothetical protein
MRRVGMFISFSFHVCGGKDWRNSARYLKCDTQTQTHIVTYVCYIYIHTYTYLNVYVNHHATWNVEVISDKSNALESVFQNLVLRKNKTQQQQQQQDDDNRK